ncbi:NAD(P)/FAD-dependent oxidoreductase [Streptomyces peucetius]|uniref:FAD-dependent oxidoreductase n=1 Tax=Streptomyces peucetius TaxID=1950 RepID=A0ABY6I420_STRPE|nr:NAD(P)/FAD-dependent oxidoreductase [Streptomyces peucetius]UYQ61726.1 FAD-dependent oxidoreductase [Streptomyces peucetius]
MLSTAHDADVVIVGGGIAGLSAAHRLTGAGVTVSVLEAAPVVGRTATVQLDGFRLDRTGRLLCTSYPELRRTAALRDADLRMFSPGVLVHSGGRLQRTGEVGGARWGSVHGRRSAGRGAPPGGQGSGSGVAFSVARALASAPRPRQLDQARLGASLARLAATPVDRVLARPERSAAEALYGRGLPPRTVHGFLRPLLSALLGDPELTSTSSRCADLALRGYARGRLCVPAGGAATLPELLAAGLPAGSVRTGVKVTDVSTTSVTTEEYGQVHCRSVLLATGARAAAELLPGLRVPSYHPVTVLHHTAPESPLRDPSLVLDADRSGPVSHTAVMSEVDPSRASDGRVLISSTVLGEPPEDLDRRVRRQLATLYGRPTDDWELLAVHYDPEAVPAMPAPHDLRRPVRVLSGLYVCGDHRDTGTVQGALFSGRRAAHAILNDFGIRPGTAAASLTAAA